MPALDLIQGTLDLLVLQSLVAGPRHGYAVARAIRQGSGETLEVEDRALYVALHRLEARGWVRSEWGLSDNNRRAKFYQLTPVGRRALVQKAGDWRAYARAVFQILGPAGTTA